jgi:16S rRNA (adenine1518-N6/adenine1519-N6)-dimethyltransferase
MDWVIVHYKKISKGLFMMQREFVNKFISPSNAQSLVFSLLYRVGKRFEVHPGSFSPRPLVNSTVFLFERTFSPFENEIDVTAFYIFLRQCFRNRRKTLFNNLAAIYGTKTSTDIFAKLSIPPKIRAEQLTLEVFLEVFQSFSSSVIKIC